MYLSEVTFDLIVGKGYGLDHYSSSLKPQNSRDLFFHDRLYADQECRMAVSVVRSGRGCKRSWLYVFHRLRLHGW